MKSKPSPIAIIIAAAMALREILRDNEQYEWADKIRDALVTFGVNVEDKK
jgi:cysteinyl-tRNA synthetase